MRTDIETVPKGHPVIVAWLDQFKDQRTYVAMKMHEGLWMANGIGQIAEPTHWMEIPSIKE